jgi:hypothetical protein
MEQTKIVPPITIYSWPEMAIPEDEIKNILTYLVYKTGKPVTFSQYTEDEGYSENSVSVRIAVADGLRKTSKTPSIELGGKTYKLSRGQVSVDIDIDVSDEKRILGDNSVTLACIDHNRIIIPIELTATDNESARSLLAYIIERSIELLDFKMTDKLLEQRRKLAQKFCETFAKGVEKRINEKEEDLKERQHQAEQAYYTIIDFENRKPVIEKELKFFKKLQQIRRPRLFRKQAQALIELLATGQYTRIEPYDDGSIIAATSPITIEYGNHKFTLGSYEIKIDAKGDVRIEAIDEHPNAEHPHPHVSEDGYPCLGNIAADIPKMIGSMRIAEALQVLYEFLCQYNSENPYEKISHFDPTGEYQDEDDNPCEDCDESCTPYCIHECGDNDGQYSCSDCCDYRSDYCYQDCDYNQDFEQFSPCDDCDQKATEHCYLHCQYNEQWKLHNPCEEDCKFDECSSQCQFYSKSQRLKEVTKDADRK